MRVRHDLDELKEDRKKAEEDLALIKQEKLELKQIAAKKREVDGTELRHDWDEAYLTLVCIPCNQNLLLNCRAERTKLMLFAVVSKRARESFSKIERCSNTRRSSSQRNRSR